MALLASLSVRGGTSTHTREPVVTNNTHGCVAVVAHFTANADRASAMLDDVRSVVPHDCQVSVYDKGPAPCSFMPSDRIGVCEALPNVGREQHTFAHHIATHYDDLPASLILLPSDLTRHGRHALLEQMIGEQQRRPRFTCVTGDYRISTAPKGDAACALDRYASCTMQCYSNCHQPNASHRLVPSPASPQGLAPWLAAHVASIPLCMLPACHFGIATATRADLHTRPRSVYENVARQLSSANLPETAFYGEWAMAAIFGGPSAWKRSTTASCPVGDTVAGWPGYSVAGPACRRVECEKVLMQLNPTWNKSARAFVGGR